MIFFTALPSHGGVPGGGGCQWEAAAGGNSPRQGGGYAERPAPSGPGELPGCPAGRPPQGKHHTPASENIFNSLLTSPSVSCLFLPSQHTRTYFCQTTLGLLWPVTNLTSCQKTLCQLTVHHEENGLLCPEKHTYRTPSRVNHIWTSALIPVTCLLFVLL